MCGIEQSLLYSSQTKHFANAKIFKLMELKATFCDSKTHVLVYS
jgi:hypothetical protein